MGRPARATRGGRPERAVVVGGGYIGIETAEAFVRRGLETTLVTRNEVDEHARPRHGRAGAGGDDRGRRPRGVQRGGRRPGPAARRLGGRGALRRRRLPGRRRRARPRCHTGHRRWRPPRACRSARSAACCPTTASASRTASGPPATAASRWSGSRATACTCRWARTRTSRGGSRARTSRAARPGSAGCWGRRSRNSPPVVRTSRSGGRAPRRSRRVPTGARWCRWSPSRRRRAATCRRRRRSPSRCSPRADGRLVGVQIVGGAGSAKRIDTAAVALWHHDTAEAVAGMDLAYAPPFSPVWDPVQIACRRLRRPAGLARAADRDASGAARPLVAGFVHAHRHPRGLRADARHGEGARLRLPGHQRDVVADAERRHPRLRRGRERRHRAGVDRRGRVPVGPGREGHGDRRGRARRLRPRGREEVPGEHRAAHRPLPEGQARRLRPPAAGDQQRARGARREPALPVAHVGRLGRPAGREPAHRPRAARPRPPPRGSSSRSRSASSAARRTASRTRSTRSSTRPSTTGWPSPRRWGSASAAGTWQR